MQSSVRSAIPSGVWALGVVSLLMDVSSEIVNALLPMYMVTNLMASTVFVGAVEGLAGATAMTTRMVSGIWSDRTASRKRLTVIGYVLAALSKPLVPLTGTLGGIVLAKFLDRVGKGVRSAPRDALVADLSPPEIRGASFGVRKALDTVGGFAGPLAAMALMIATANDIVTVFWIATIPAVCAVGVLILGVQEPSRASERRAGPAPRWSDAVRMTPALWLVVGVASLLSLARFSEAFLLLRASDLGIAPARVPLVLVVLHAVYGLSSYPAGRLSDRYGRKPFLIAGVAVLIAAHLTLAFATSATIFWTGIAAWGLHMGLTQGMVATLVADAAPSHLRGSAFGILSVATGIAIAVGNVLAGVIWESFDPSSLFVTAAVVAAVVLSLLVATRLEHRQAVENA